MEKRNIIVIGASAGGFAGIRQIVHDLPADLDASIFVVWHMAADMTGVLPRALNKEEGLPAANGVDGEGIMKRRIYVAPPDHHMLLEKGMVRITKGPKENRFRPAIDPLFRSAALAFGTRVIGVILSGALDDGTAGMWAIKQQGGISIVQSPEDADVSSMPKHVINAVKVDHILPVNQIGALLTRLVNEEVGSQHTVDPAYEKFSRMEVGIAMEERKPKHTILEFGDISPFTCPECHGVLTELREGGRMRYRCHTGHAFSADSLLTSITEHIEEVLWVAIRSIQESIIFLNHMGDHFAEANQGNIAAMYFKKAGEAMQRAELVRKAVFDHELLNVNSIQEQADLPDNS